MSNEIQKVAGDDSLSNILNKANERGHGMATKGSGIGGLLGGILGSFLGPAGAAVGAGIGAAIGNVVLGEKDKKS